MKLKIVWTFAIVLISPCFATPNWPQIVHQLNTDPKKLDLEPIHIGASNTNYILKTTEGRFFVRIAPENRANLYADLNIENEVLQKLSALHTCAAPLYFDENRRILITDYLAHDPKDLSLKEATLRAKVFEQLKIIRDSKISISRTFSPKNDIEKLISFSDKAGVKKLESHYFTKLLPALEKIDRILEKNPEKTLCHLDLHNKNILQDKDTVYLIDWEYATMGHPLLILASMASIERWDDATMMQVLKEYMESPSKQDEETLYLYRIVADLFWAVWNHIQVKLSPTDNPYSIWEELFEKEAVARIHSETFHNILDNHNQ